MLHGSYDSAKQRTFFMQTALTHGKITVNMLLFALPLMKIFMDAKETAVIAVGAEYLKIEGAIYLGIGI